MYCHLPWFGFGICFVVEVALYLKLILHCLCWFQTVELLEIPCFVYFIASSLISFPLSGGGVSLVTYNFGTALYMCIDHTIRYFASKNRVWYLFLHPTRYYYYTGHWHLDGKSLSIILRGPRGCEEKNKQNGDLFTIGS